MVSRNMVSLRQIFKMLALLFWLGTSAAYADPPAQSQHFVGLYDFSWEGIPLAKAEFAIDETSDDYALKLAIRSAGIVNLFTRHRSDTQAQGKRVGNRYLPALYESHYWTKNKPRHIKIVFDAKGRVKEELVEPPEDRTERAEVPHALKDGALDPLTLVLAVGAGNLTPRVFDAKHLYDGKAIKGETTSIRTINGPMDAIPYDLSRTPVSGMTQKEMQEYAKGEPPLLFYMSADGRSVPLYMTMPIYLGYLKGHLIKECKAWDECKVE